MSDPHRLQECLHSVIAGAGDTGPTLSRRAALLSALIAGLPLAASGRRAGASGIDPKETFVVLPKDIKWTAWSGLPEHSGEMATLVGGLDKPGPYLVLMKWNPGFMSAPHSYATDRLCVVVSGTWWVNSGAGFRPGALRCRAGRRVRPARRPHTAL